jgi:hypothetical protein
MAGASLADPALIRDFLGRLARFQQLAEGELANAPLLLARTLDHLRLDLRPRWKREWVKRQELFAVARRAWLEAEAEMRASGQRGAIDRASALDERREMLKAQRRVEEAEDKLRQLTACIDSLEHDGKELEARCCSLALGLHERCTQARTDLDGRCTAIEDYLERQRQGGSA